MQTRVVQAYYISLPPGGRGAAIAVEGARVIMRENIQFYRRVRMQTRVVQAYYISLPPGGRGTAIAVEGARVIMREYIQFYRRVRMQTRGGLSESQNSNLRFHLAVCQSHKGVGSNKFSLAKTCRSSTQYR